MKKWKGIMIVSLVFALALSIVSSFCFGVYIMIPKPKNITFTDYLLLNATFLASGLPQNILDDFPIRRIDEVKRDGEILMYVYTVGKPYKILKSRSLIPYWTMEPVL
jgi:hypothetical protein